MQHNLTETSLAVFIAYANDATNWGGNPLVGGNVGGTKEERGNLTQLKKEGYITTLVEDGNVWLNFTSKGVELAASLGIQLSV